jgi:hypothetical protein
MASISVHVPVANLPAAKIFGDDLTSSVDEYRLLPIGLPHARSVPYVPRKRYSEVSTHRSHPCACPSQGDRLVNPFKRERDAFERVARVLALLLVLAAAAFLARHVWTVFSGPTIDDAAISYSYASNLAEGHGLRNTPGASPAEGFSNPLEVLLLGGFTFFHAALDVAAKGINLAFLLAGLVGWRILVAWRARGIGRFFAPPGRNLEKFLPAFPYLGKNTFSGGLSSPATEHRALSSPLVTDLLGGFQGAYNLDFRLLTHLIASSRRRGRCRTARARARHAIGAVNTLLGFVGVEGLSRVALGVGSRALRSLHLGNAVLNRSVAAKSRKRRHAATMIAPFAESGYFLVTCSLGRQIATIAATSLQAVQTKAKNYKKRNRSHGSSNF